MAIAVNIGLSESEREQVAQAMSELLADSYTLYLKTHNYHWNVTGPHFAALHAMFETQYQEQWLAVDEIAERIRSVGFAAPGTYAQFSALTGITEADGIPSAMTMVEHLARDNEHVARTAGKAFDVAEKVGDQSSADLAVGRQQVHEKNAWMLRSMLE